MDNSIKRLKMMKEMMVHDSYRGSLEDYNNDLTTE